MLNEEIEKIKNKRMELMKASHFKLKLSNYQRCH